MSFSWLQMRITEEQDRREREAQILERLPRVLEDVHRALVTCVEGYSAAFGPEAIELRAQSQKLLITVRERRDERWESIARVEVSLLRTLPGLHIDRDATVLDVEVGLLPGEKTFYKDGEEFITLEELTRRILDRALFPKLGE